VKPKGSEILKGRTTFAKAYGIKVRCYGEHLGEHIRKLMRTHWGLKRNIVGTQWEPGKMKKKCFPSPPSKLKRKKPRHLECMLGPSNWLHAISLPKTVYHHFWPGLIPLAMNTLPNAPPYKLGVLIILFHID